MKDVAPTRGIVVDIDAELAYWRNVLPQSEFRDLPFDFDRLVPTIKFGYDCYLQHSPASLAEVLPEARQKYESTLPAYYRLDWRWADQILRHAWGRMKDA